MPSIALPTQDPCSTVPVQVLLPSGVTPTDVAQDVYGGYAIGSDRKHPRRWGGGNPGDGNFRASSTPVVVSLPTGSSPVALGQDPEGLSYAIVNVPVAAPAITTNPQSQGTTGGQTVTFTAAASDLRSRRCSGSNPPTEGPPGPTSRGRRPTPTSSPMCLSLTTVTSCALLHQRRRHGHDERRDAHRHRPPPPTTSVGLPANGATVSGDTWLDAVARVRSASPR